MKNYNPGQNIWNKIGKSSKTIKDKKSLISTFACFLTAIAKVWFLEGRPDTGRHVSTQIWYFLSISLFPKIPSLKSFGHSWGNSYTKFAILDITFHIKTLWSSKILWPRLSGSFLFALYTSIDNLNSWKKCSFASKKS